MTIAMDNPCRVLTRADAVLLAQFDPESIAPVGIATELSAPDDYTWMGLFVDGHLAAVHRAMRWGPYLLLKGLLVAPEHRGSTAAIRLAIALREHARSAGYAGVVVWVEPAKPESEIAARLRVEMRGPLVHRIEIPLPRDGGCHGRGSQPSIRSGTMSIEQHRKPMVPDLVTPSGNGSGPVLHWVSDRDRIVLSGNPCGSIADLPELVSAVTPVAQSVGATAVEVPIMAFDLETLIALAATGARRLSRTPVYLGLRAFR